MSAHHAKGTSKTLPMTVKNTGFLLDRLGEDCHPLQFLRELTQNSVEAILRTKEKRGEIVWDVDWNMYDLDGTGIYKLCITDTGDGMTGDDMVTYINQLSSSSSEQSLCGNYGVGAKIAAATRNHEGVIYLSWKGGQGAMIHLWRHPETGTYGLKQFERSDGTYPYHLELEDAIKPDIIGDHGTKIVLFGRADAEDTMQSPDGAPSPSRWIAKYLNTRYFRFPKGITVRAREGWQNPRADKDRNLLRTLMGQEQYLNEHAASKGKVQLTSAVARWWILKDEPAITNNSGFIESSGHVAALYQDELYEMATSRAGTAKLQQFGVIFGCRQVVIYLEPLADKNRLTTNTARTSLLLNNEPLPWADWAVEFREDMPGEIKELIDEKAAESSTEDHSKSIRERLKQILDLFRVSRYRPSATGDVLIDDQQTVRGGQGRRGAGGTQAGEGGQSSRRGGTAGSIYSVFQKEDGTPGQKVKSEIFPEVKWISFKDGTRDRGDLEDRAAKYLRDQNLLLINADFRVFTDMVEKWCKEFGGSPAIGDLVEDAVHAWFEQALVESVLGMQALRHGKEWSDHHIDSALSEEALTTAVMQRYHVNNSVKRELGSKLGKIQGAKEQVGADG